MLHRRVTSCHAERTDVLVQQRTDSGSLMDSSCSQETLPRIHANRGSMPADSRR